MNAPTVKRLGIVCALALVMLGASVTDALATHFRYGQITWRVPNPAQKNVVEFRFEMAFRRSYFSPVPTLGPPATIQNVGPIYIERINAAGQVLQTLVNQTVNVNLTTTQVYAADDAWIGVFTYTFAFPANTPSSIYRVRYTGCCRVSTIVDANHDLDYTVTTKLTLDTTGAGVVNNSPISTSLPVVHVVIGRPVSQIIPALDPDGDPVTFRLATQAESSLLVLNPAGSPPFSVAANGTVTWTPNLVGLYAVQVVISDTKGASTVLDCLYEVHPVVGQTPTITINNTTGPVTLRVPVGYALSVPITARDPDSASPLTIGAGFLPAASITSPALPATLQPSGVNQPVTATFRWTPGVADIGPHPFIFTATDNNFQQIQQSLTVIVDQTLGLYISGVLRDFGAGTDFGRPDGDNAPTRIVSNSLGANSKPVYQPVNTTTNLPVATTTVSTAATFSSWWAGSGQVTTLGLLNSPANPNVYSFNSAQFGLPGHNYFTYEAHTFFTYQGGEILNYSSSDDLWVFLNGKLVADLGGIHTTARTFQVNVNNLALSLGMVVGQTYRMDIFYAHRGSTHGASVGIETTEVAFCDPVSASSPVALSSRVGRAVLNGDGSTRLIAGSELSLAGAAWSADRVPVAAGFTAEFDFTIAASGAGEGLAFVLQDSAANALGSAAGSLGYGGAAGIVKSLAVEFDTHQDAANGDPAFDSISVHTALAAANSALEASSLGASGSGITGEMNDGVSHHAKVTYSPDPQGTMFLHVYLNEAAAASLEVPITQEQMLQIFPNGLAYVGFTSSNDSTLAGTVTVKNLEVGSAEPAPSLTTILFPPSAQEHDVTGQVTIQARDACNSKIRFGGMSLVATMTTDSYDTDVTVTDNSDGTYTLHFTPRVGGAWQLAVTSDGTAIKNSPFTVPVSPATPTLSVKGGTLPYNSFPQSASGIALGVFNEDLGPLTFTYNGGESAIDAGTYAVIGSFDGNSHYDAASLESVTPLVITPIDPTVHVNDAMVIYDRQPHHATGTATGLNSEDLGALSFTYDGSATAPVNAHTYVVMGSFAGSTNYNALNGTGSLEIKKAAPTVHVNAASYTYDAAAHPATGSVTGVDDEDLGAVDTFTYNPGSGAPINAGSYQATGIYPGSDNYLAADGVGTIDIDQAMPTVHVDSLSFTYDANSHSATGSVTGVNGEALGSPTAFAYTPGGSVPADAGTYDVLANFAGGGNYKPASGTGTLTISVATPTVHVNTLSFTYDGNSHAATGTVTGVNGELLSPLTFTYNGNAAAPAGAGSYVVVGEFAAAGNYGSASGGGSLTIGKATPVISWATPGAIVYGTALSGTQLNASTGPGGTFTYAPAAGAVLHAGSRLLSVAFAPADADNYESATAEVTLAVSTAPLTIRANSAAKIYGAALPALSASGEGFVNGDTLASLLTPPVVSTLATAASTVGGYPINVAGATSADYSIVFASGTLTVGRALLTITGDNKTMIQGFPVPALTASYAGFVNGDTVASLDTPVSLTTTGTSASTPGSYPIVPSGASDANYTVSLVDGTLTISASFKAGIAAARDGLAALVPGNKAIGRLNEALDPSLWSDETHLTAQGQRVFESLRQAISELLKISNPPPAVLAAIQRLVGIARQLVTDAISVAQAAGRNVTQAQAFLVAGDARSAAGDWDGAMQRYKQAWQQAY